MRFTRRVRSTSELDDGLGAPPSRTWRRRVLPVVLPLVLVLLLAGVVATSVVLLRDRREPPTTVALLQPAALGSSDSRATPAGGALARATLAAATYFTLDYRQLDADQDRMRALGTPAFVADYDADTAALVARIAQRRIKLVADIPSGGVATEYLTAELAQVVVAVDVTRLTTRGADTRSTTAYRIRLTLERSGDSWLVSALDEVR